MLATVFYHAFTGCDTVSSIVGHGKCALFDKFCAGGIDEYMDVLHATKNMVTRGGIGIIIQMHQLVLLEKFDTTCSSTYKAAAGLIKPEAQTPTEVAAAQRLLCAYLQNRAVAKHVFELWSV